MATHITFRVRLKNEAAVKRLAEATLKVVQAAEDQPWNSELKEAAGALTYIVRNGLVSEQEKKDGK